MNTQVTTFENEHLENAVKGIELTQVFKTISEDKDFVEAWKISKFRFVTIFNLINNYFPMTSSVHKVFSEYIGIAMRKMYPTEYVLVADRFELMNARDHDQMALVRLRFKPRYEVEWNSRFVQFSVAGLLYDDEGIYCLIPRKGNMLGKTTMIQGHISYNKSFYLEFGGDVIDMQHIYPSEFIKNEFLRELSEETSFEPQDLESPENWFFGKMACSPDPCEVGHYHRGFVFIARVVNMNKIDLGSREPEKHSICKIPWNSVIAGDFVNTLGGPDSWLEPTINNILNLIKSGELVINIPTAPALQ